MSRQDMSGRLLSVSESSHSRAMLKPQTHTRTRAKLHGYGHTTLQHASTFDGETPRHDHTTYC